jgi:DNA replication protein DnaC
MIIPERFSIEGIEVNELANMLYECYRCELEKRHRKIVLDEDTKAHIKETAEWLTSTDKFGIIFMGLYGNGKTTLMKATQQLINNLFASAIKSEQRAVRFIKAKDILKVKNNSTVCADNSKLFEELIRVELLAIDELGSEPQETRTFGNINTPMIDLLEERYERQLFTMVTTNLLPKEIREHYGERVADRFNEMFHRIIFKNQSYRK